MRPQENLLEFSIKAGISENTQTACSVVGVFSSRKLSSAAAQIDRASKGYLTRILKGGDMEGKAGSTLLLQALPNIKAERVLLVGLGPAEEFRDRQYRDAVAAAISALNTTGATDAWIHLPECAVTKRDIGWRIAQAVVAARATTYRFDQMKSRPKKRNRHCAASPSALMMQQPNALQPLVWNKDSPSQTVSASHVTSAICRVTFARQPTLPRWHAIWPNITV